MIDVALQLAREAGLRLMQGWGAPMSAERKGDASNVVTQADRDAERVVVDGLRARFPDHSIVAEESGCALRGGPITWVVDPLDGTSNYAAGLPWFGVLVAALRDRVPVVAVMHLPAEGTTYAAEAGAGAWRDGTRLSVTAEASPANVLWAFAMDTGRAGPVRRRAALYAELVLRVRGVRGTQCVVDAAQVADGRLGGLVNLNSRLWDVAAPMLVVQESGGLYTAADGSPLRLDLSARAAAREYAVLAAAPALHAALAPIARRVLGSRPARARRSAHVQRRPELPAPA